MISSTENELTGNVDCIHDTSSVTNIVVNNITYTKLIKGGLQTVESR